MAKTKIALLYERLSCDDELQGESFSIQNQDGICQGYFHQRFRRATFTANGSFSRRSNGAYKIFDKLLQKEFRFVIT